MADPGKVDFKKTIAAYRARRAFEIVDVPELQYLMVDGHGDPNTSVFTDAVEALYPIAYKLKFASKKSLGRDYVVMPLEGLWWADDMATFTAARDKSRWDWTLMIMVPEWISAEMFAEVAPPESPVRLESLAEGKCVQTLHVGSFDDEAGVLDEMHNSFIPSYGMKVTGKHHEIYLSDRRKTEPAKLRTILRQPVLE
ncbi:GyrI-like domain-containing protein [Paractinoplanes lichenicola]|uniref:GyrI-like domain-containing protein n=1 Tax=Paractinoplanes lichenicola TaxID=2802976 RepID=A0ABS1W4B2_9ACTN|nr:GyrI-like domain-containing protein [Actinoplanes lichenicola]MBL7261564.1 GyrI-like domain-containing protein [Actinoplanes lichenicola]